MANMGKQPQKEEHALILDYLPYGNTSDNRPAYQKKPLVQALGEKYFVLMEMVPKEGVIPEIQSRVYIGKGDRDVIDHVKSRILYAELTHGAQLELPYLIEICVKNQEEKFVKFFNEAHSVTTRLHMLELLPGIGKKLMWAIIDERKKGNFKSFKDLNNRVSGLHAPEKVIVNRILEELKNDLIKYRLFTTPMHRSTHD
ncbi:MAG: DUF655 domain-containing protein [Methanosarcinaceae archaeon]|nr:DUF655 domain-containing protein [Methanosarcinaceae archaeon]